MRHLSASVEIRSATQQYKAVAAISLIDTLIAFLFSRSSCELQQSGRVDDCDMKGFVMRNALQLIIKRAIKAVPTNDICVTFMN